MSNDQYEKEIKTDATPRFIHSRGIGITHDTRSALSDPKKQKQGVDFLIDLSGLTPQNIINLRTVDIDLDAGTVYVMATKQLSRRTLELRSNQVLALISYIDQDRVELMKTGSPRLFVTKLGENLSVDALNRMLRPLQGLYTDKKLNASTIRQSVISNWINHYKYGLDDVQLLAGHRWLSSTLKYKVVNREENREKINRFFPL